MKTEFKQAELDFNDVYKLLLKQHGHQQWWPADTRFEIMIGSILTQNTAWKNVEQAINNLKDADCLRPEAICSTSKARLAELIKPSGYFNVKAGYLKNFCEWYIENGSFENLCFLSTENLRKELLKIKGIGFETADDIVLYAFDRPVFVIDAYTRRIFSRLELIRGKEKYDQLRFIFESQIKNDPELFAEYHALIVNHGKDICKPKPNCEVCGLNQACFFAKG